MDTTIRQQISILLTDDDPDTRRTAAENLSEIKDSAVNAALVAALDDESKGVQDAAMRALVEIGGGDVARTIACLIVNEDIATRNLAAKVLMKIGEPAIRYLLPYAKDSSKDVRKFTIDILGRIGSKESLSYLLPLLKDADPNVRIATVEALSIIGSEEATLPLCEVFATDPLLMGCAADALGTIGDTRGLAFLTESFAKGLNRPSSDLLTISAIVEAFGKLGNLETLAELQRHLGAVHGELRLILMDAMVRIAGRYREPLKFDDSFRDDLLYGLHSDSENIRVSCVKALTTFQGADVTRSLISALGEDDALESVLFGHLTTRPDTFSICVEFLEKSVGKSRKCVIRLLGTIAWNCVNLFYQSMDSYLNMDLLQRAFAAVQQQWEISDEETRESIIDTLFLIDGRRAVSALSEFIGDTDSWLLPRIIEQLSKSDNENQPRV